MYQETSREVLNFIEHSPSCFHAVEQLPQMLDQAGYQRLKECDGWTLEQGGKYYVTRNGSSIIAFHGQLPLPDHRLPQRLSQL